MLNIIRSLLFAGLASLRTRGQLAVEILALRQQLGVLKRSVKRPRLTNADRGLWVLLSRRWSRSSDALLIVKPATVVRWHRAGFRRYWAWRSRPKGGRPGIDPEIRALIKRMATSNLWGAPRIHGELLKLGINVSEATVSRYLPRRRKPPSQTWRALHARFRRLLHGADGVLPGPVRVRRSGARPSAHPQHQRHGQSVRRVDGQPVQAFPWESAPRYLLRDRDGIYGKQFRSRVQNLGIQEVIIARRSPWQTPYVERVIGTLRREVVDHTIVMKERHLRRLLRRYVSEYYHPCRTHLSLGKDSPEPRAVEPPEMGEVIELPLVDGLHHRYARRAA